MDDEATRLLREIRDILVGSAEREEAWRAETRAVLKRNQRLVAVLLLVLLLASIGLLLWGMMSTEVSTGDAPILQGELEGKFRVSGSNCGSPRSEGG